MKVARSISRVGVLALMAVLLLPLGALADTAQPRLQIREINLTGEEFVVLQNAGTAAAQLDQYWLGYSTDDATNYVVPTQQLPAGSLAPGQAILLNNGSVSTCDATVVDQLGFSSLSNTKGTLQLRQLTNTGVSSTFTTVDSVAWGKLPADAIQIAKESQLSDDANAVWYRNVSDNAALWRVGDLQDCSLALASLPSDDPALPPPVVVWPVSTTSPPSILVGSSPHSSKPTPGIPASDKGLKAPQLSEILPNPASPQTDAVDEFIELYNPNGRAFDLSGFMLQTASTSSSTTHTYHFPAGTTINAGGFRAFKSSQTHLALSNSGGQVWLVDPLGTTLDTCDPYGTAKDGQSWVDASGKWQWTLQATPGTTNKLAMPIATNGSSKTATVNGKKVTAITGGSSGAGSTLGANTVAEQQPTPLSIHPLTLAIIIVVGLLYGAYEYRYDLALKYRQLRRNRSAGR